MFVIRKPQMDKFSEAKHRTFDKKALAYLFQCFPNRCERLGEKNVRNVNGLARILSNVEDEEYIVVMWTNYLGFHFARRDMDTEEWYWKDATFGTVKKFS